MSDHAVTLFELGNAPNLIFDYRLLEIDGVLRAAQGDDDQIDRNLNLLSKIVAIKARTAVAVVRRSGKPYLAIPADREFKEQEVTITPTIVTLRPQGEVHRLRTADQENRNIALRFLEFALRGPLNNDPELWSSNPRTFLRRRPINYHDSNRETDLFEGFHFHLRFLDSRLFLGVNLSYKYIDSSWLVDRFKPDEIRRLKMRHFLYHYGHQLYVVQLLDLLPQNIADARFVPYGSNDPVSVYDYTRAAWQKNPPQWITALNPESAAITYRYPSRDQHRFGAAALAKLIRRTDDPEAASLHCRSIKRPAERFKFTEDIVRRYFARASFGNTELGITQNAHQVSPRYFAVPPLEFGQGQVLRVAQQPSATTVLLKDLPAKRMNLLLDPQAGFAVTSPLDSQYILVPQSLDRDIAADFRKNLEATVRGFIHSPYKLDLVLYDDRSAKTLKQQVDAITAALTTSRVNHGHGVLILPAYANRGLHNYIKAKLRDVIQVQCVSARKVADFYRTVIRSQKRETEVLSEQRGKYTSYLRYTALGLLIVNRQWGWVLPQGTHYDAYISFDVLNNHAAFSFFYRGGKDCFVRTYPSKQKEKLLAAQVREIVYESLKRDLSSKGAIRSIVLRRDGRLFESEWLGFQSAIRRLIEEGILDASVQFGAVEVQKNFTNGVRIARRGSDGYQNPRIGVALPLSQTDGILCNTGYPFKLVGSVKPLHVAIARGSLDLMKVLEDTFRMSLLSYPVPDRVMRLPIDMKLCDEFLRAVASESDEDEALYGVEEIELPNVVNS